MTKDKRTLKKAVTEEILGSGKNVAGDFDDSQGLFVPAPQNKMISIRLPINMLRQLRTIAVTKGDIGYQQLIKAYVAEGIRGDYDALLRLHSVSEDASSSANFQELEIV